MSFTVGLDFGTHQTKVCIEDASNPAQKIYEFIEFENPYGNPSVLLPSIVQINEDDTLSYGFVNEEKCKCLHSDGLAKPKLKQIKKPQLILPPEPSKPIFPNKPKVQAHSWKEKIRDLFNTIRRKVAPEIIEWQATCDKIRDEHQQTVNKWNDECNILKEEHRRKIEIWKSDCEKLEKEYQEKLIEWKKKLIENFYFRYFKLSAFSNSVQWDHKISPDLISVWYIAYILFSLQEKLGEDFFVQMGIPSGTNQRILLKQKQKAFSILIAAYKLVDKYGNKENFLSENYTRLIEATELNINYSEEDLFFYGLNVVPEAFAGLSSVTQQKRLETGMSLLVDIGGGTTDVAFFSIRDNQPDIHSVLSFPKGLNFIFENYIKKNKHLTLSEVQNIFLEKRGDKSLFHLSISQYHSQLRNQVRRMIKEITRSFEFRKDFHKLSTSQLRVALENRPVVYCGGGAIYNSMQTSLQYFTDIKLINKNLLNIPFIKNQNLDEKLFIILATSYGLSIPLENEIVLTPIEEVFNHIEASESESDKWDYKYDHGLSDF